MTKQNFEPKKDQRRFPRVFLQSSEGFSSLVGANVQWPSGSQTGVLDLSYMGAALEIPPGGTLEKGLAVELVFLFADQKPIPVSARVIRNDGKAVGVQFSELSATARMSFENYLNDNLLGLNLRPVDPRLFSKSQDFTYWYHGPKDTNLFVWERSGELEKAIVEIDHQILVWNQGMLTQGKSRSDLNSAIDDYYSPVLYESLRAGQDADRLLLGRVVKILSQVNEKKGPVVSLLERLKESTKR